MNAIDAAWLAGFLDGEGAFDSPRGNARLRVKVTDLDLVLRAAHLMSASYYEDNWAHRQNPRHKPSWVAQITGARAVAVMREILPYMGTRRTAKITSIIAAHDIKEKKR